MVLSWNGTVYGREEVKTLKQQGKVRDYKISRDKIFGEGDYAHVNSQTTFDGHTLSLCRVAALNA